MDSRPINQETQAPIPTHQIQPHGAVLVLDRKLKVIQYSENVSKLLETPIHQLSVTPIDNFLNPENPNENILVWLNQANNQYKRINWRANQKKLIVWLYIQQMPKYILLEIEPAIEDQQHNDSPFELSDYVINSGKTSFSTLNIEQVLQNTCEEIRRITQYDRVNIYQLNDQNKPFIVAGEAIKKGLTPYIGLHFPANYIPKDIKEKYLKLPLRYIPSIDATGINIGPSINPTTKTETSLTNSNLCMITNEDRQYMIKMSAASSTSIAIIHDNKVWGLIVCQHGEHKYISTHVRLILILIANTLAKEISALERVKISEDTKRIARLQATLAQKFTKQDSLIYALDSCHQEIMEILFATGMSIYLQNNIFSYGRTPAAHEVEKLISWLKTKKPSIYATSTLPYELEDSNHFIDRACGLLALPITTLENNYLLFYRPEFIHPISWAINPTLSLEEDLSNPLIKPIIKTITKHSLPWTQYDIKSSEFIRSIIVNKQLQDLLQIKSMHDPLTGLLNHLYLEEQLKIEILRASREKSPITIIQFQIDSFAKIKEQHGSQAGDITLISVAKLLTSYFRGYDYIYRNGGEEFILLLPGMSHSTALERINILHNNIKNLKINISEKTLPPISICTGVATYPEHGDTLFNITNAAKTAFYLAKATGINQIVSAKNTLSTQ